MNSFPQHNLGIGDNTRGFSDAPRYDGFQETRRPSDGPFFARSRSPQPSWPRFSIPTNTDSLSSGFSYDTRLQQLGVSSNEWLRFTTEIVNEARLSLEDDKVAWTAGIATGTAGSAMLLLLGPVAGYYTGKAVHKRTVVEKVKERLLDNGQMSNVLRKWNEGAWKTRGFYTWVEVPNEGGADKKGPDTKRFRIVVIPHDGLASPPPSQRPLSPPAHTYTPPPPPMADPPFHQPSSPYGNLTSVPPPPPPPNPPWGPQVQTIPGPPPYTNQTQYHDVQAPTLGKPDHRTTPPELPFRQYSTPQIQNTHPPFIYQQQAMNHPVPEIFNYPPPPPLPAKTPEYTFPSNQMHERPNNQAPTVFELPDNQAAVTIAELPSEPVYRYEMDGGSFPPATR